MKCLACNEEAVTSSDWCKEHTPPKIRPPGKYLGRDRTVRTGKEKKRAVYPNIGHIHITGDRSTLVGRLADAVGNDHANAIADALDGYLETDPAYRLPAFPYIRPNPPNPELDKVRKERDEAVARAEKAEEKLRTPKRKSKGKLK